MGGPSVRSASLEDLDVLSELWLEVALFHEPFGPDLYTVAPLEDVRGRVLEDIEEAVSKKNRFYLVALLESGVVGYAVGELREPRPGIHPWIQRAVGYVSDFGVTETARRRGVGRALLAAVEKWSRDRGADCLRLGVDPANLGARRLYESEGFGDVSIFMHKDLP